MSKKDKRNEECYMYSLRKTVERMKALVNDGKV